MATQQKATSMSAKPAPANNVQPDLLPTQDHDQFARQQGFESYLALFEASTPLETAGEGKWLLTVLRSQEWVVWNAGDLRIRGTFSSEKEAKDSLRVENA